jgi:alpha-1,3-rhamnosyl/mannosyltransferase
MHIAVDCRWIRSQEIDGIGRYTLNIVSNLLPQVRKDRVTLLFSDPGLEQWVRSEVGVGQFENVSTHRVGSTVMTLSDVVGAGREIASINPDVLFEPNYITAAFHRSYETVVVVHDLIPLIYYDEVCTSLRWKLLYGIPVFLRLILDWAAGIVAVSEHTRDDLLEHFPVATGKTTVVHEGVDPKFFQKATVGKVKEVQATYGIPAQYVLCVSRHESYKNLRGLAEAYRQLPHELATAYPLVLTGSFDEKWSPRLKASMEDLIEAGTVTFTGFVDDEDLPAVYQGATLFCLPSQYEGFGLPLLEAMASGCPIAASNRASIPEVAGAAASYFDPDRPANIARIIETLLKDEERRAELRREGQKQLDNFSWDEAAEDILSVLRAQSYVSEE